MKNSRNDDINSKVEVKGAGCLVLIWIGAILLLLACAGWVVRIWGLI